MADLLAGTSIKAADFPPTVQAFDSTGIANIAATVFTTGTPEVGVFFVAPTTGRVLMTVGGGVRNNAANSDRLFLAPQVFQDNSSGTEILAPNVTQYGCGSGGGFTTDDYQYLSRESLLEGLTAGQVYYARVQYSTVSGAGTCDLSARQIIVKPAT